MLGTCALTTDRDLEDIIAGCWFFCQAPFSNVHFLPVSGFFNFSGTIFEYVFFTGFRFDFSERQF